MNTQINDVLFIDLFLAATIMLALVIILINYKLKFSQFLPFTAVYTIVFCLNSLFLNHCQSANKELFFAPFSGLLIPLYIFHYNYFRVKNRAKLFDLKIIQKLWVLPSFLFFGYYFYLILGQSDEEDYCIMAILEGFYISAFGLYTLSFNQNQFSSRLKNIFSIFSILLITAGTFLFMISQQSFTNLKTINSAQPSFFTDLILYLTYMLIAWYYFILTIIIMINPNDTINVEIKQIIAMPQPNVRQAIVINEQALTQKIKTGKHKVISKEQLEKYKNALDLVMQSDIYRKNNLSLLDLAKTIKIPPDHLTKVLNEKLGMNFYAYINKHRINYAVKRLKSTSKPLNLEILSLEAGFNNRASFNRYFKEFTGLTPSEFAEQEARKTLNTTND